MTFTLPSSRKLSTFSFPASASSILRPPSNDDLLPSNWNALSFDFDCDDATIGAMVAAGLLGSSGARLTWKGFREACHRAVLSVSSVHRLQMESGGYTFVL